MYKILIVDDFPSVISEIRAIISPPVTAAEQMRLLLEGKALPSIGGASKPDYEFVEAYSAEDGLDKIIQSREEGRLFDLVITDMKMPPGADGIDMIRIAMQSEERIPFIMCTAYTGLNSTELIGAIDGEPRAVIAKPIDPDLLRNEVKKALECSVSKTAK